MHDFLDNLANHQYRKMYKDKDKEIEKSLEAYREAAKADAWLFGDYDVYKSYDINKKKVSDSDEIVQLISY